MQGTEQVIAGVLLSAATGTMAWVVKSLLALMRDQARLVERVGALTRDSEQAQLRVGELLDRVAVRLDDLDRRIAHLEGARWGHITGGAVNPARWRIEER